MVNYGRKQQLHPILLNLTLSCHFARLIYMPHCAVRSKRATITYGSMQLLSTICHNITREACTPTIISKFSHVIIIFSTWSLFPSNFSAVCLQQQTADMVTLLVSVKSALLEHQLSKKVLIRALNSSERATLGVIKRDWSTQKRLKIVVRARRPP